MQMHRSANNALSRGRAALATLFLVLFVPPPTVVAEGPVVGIVSRNAMVQSIGKFDERFPAPRIKTVRLEKSIRVPMRDGVRLSTDLYFPHGADGPFPVIAIRLPYDKNTYTKYREPGSVAHFFAGHGYVVAIQDMRGRFESEGDYTYFSEDREGEDGYDFVEWLSRQPWSTGKVGTYGCSYLGENQIVLAAERHPNHLAAVPQAAGGAYAGTDRQIMGVDGGVPELATIVGWMLQAGDQIFARPPPTLTEEQFNILAERFRTRLERPPVKEKDAFNVLPVVDALKKSGHHIPTEYERYISHVPRDSHYDKLSTVTDEDRFDVPALHVNSWYDGAADETLRLFNLFQANAVTDRARQGQYVVISPTTHCRSEHPSASVVVGQRRMDNSRLRYFEIYLKWFDRWLKGIDNGVENMPHVQYYLMGAGEWRRADRWPLPETEFVNYYFRSAGRANSRRGDGSLSETAPSGDEPPDTYTYDPRDPVPSVGGPICCTSEAAAPAGSYDQAKVELRNDVLVYSTPTLKQGLEVTGPLKVVLYVSSSAPDTDFTVKLVDVDRQGRAYNVQESILRARYREGLPKPKMMKPGEVYRLEVNLHSTANYFAPGHKVRLEVSSSNFPRFARNLNTGQPNHLEAEPVVARNTIHHSDEYPSHVVLPVIRRAPDR